MADKHTVTLWPPENGAEPHIPIEVQPDRAEMMIGKGWRTAEQRPQANKRLRKSEENAELSESLGTSD